MFDNDITLNANAHTGVNAPLVVSRQLGNASKWSAPSLINTTPLELDVQHTEVKKGKDLYIRSTIGLVRKELLSTTGSGLVSSTARLIIERPKDPTAISTLEIATQLGQLLSVLGVTLYSGSSPTTALLKLINREG